MSSHYFPISTDQHASWLNVEQLIRFWLSVVKHHWHNGNSSNTWEYNSDVKMLFWQLNSGDGDKYFSEFWKLECESCLKEESCRWSAARWINSVNSDLSPIISQAQTRQCLSNTKVNACSLSTIHISYPKALNKMRKKIWSQFEYIFCISGKD